jgi:murein DD-endopeptidase MepM/ murein hydrolase activator NlpD
MIVRTGRGDQSRALLIALAFVAPILLTGCATPRTHFDWGTGRTASHRPPARPVQQAAARPQAQPKPRCSCDNVPVPEPRPTPAWYHPATPSTNSNADETAAVPAGSAKFAWPMQGRILSSYGSVASGGRNDGINIEASYGEPIRAAADGVVSYTGNDLKSYGNLTLIKHAGDFVTAYAHAERFVVNRGDHVARGQVIGYAGRSGDVGSPQLHFEIRRGVKPVNPRPLLGPLQVASR